ncbi:hypothetical protein TNCV_4303511 [Trichonephila clavipes]|nr:hypothetical protein TNCV_4303511 [Trichonephila clavipes]
MVVSGALGLFLHHEMNPCESQIFGCTLVPREEPLQNSNSTRLLLQGRGTVTQDAPDIVFLVFSPFVTWTAVREPGVLECLLRGRRVCWNF